MEASEAGGEEEEEPDHPGRCWLVPCQLVTEVLQCCGAQLYLIVQTVIGHTALQDCTRLPTIQRSSSGHNYRANHRGLTKTNRQLVEL